LSHIIVFGAARSGVAAANFLVRQGEQVVLTDVAEEPALPRLAQLDRRVRRVLGAHPDSLLQGATRIVLSPGIPKTIPILRKATERGIPIISEIELAFRHLRGEIIAITGTNGKSTTTVLLGEILRAAGRKPVVAGNIGDPLIAAVDEMEARVYVIELSSFQLETVETFRPHVALLLNIAPDHLDRYDSMNDYAAAKYRIFRNQREDDFAIVNGDDERTAEPDTRARVLRFSSRGELAGDGAWHVGDQLVCRIGSREGSIRRSELQLEGEANVENALAAWLAAAALGVGDEPVREAFATFRGLPHRMMVVAESHGVRWINDSKGTNIDATLKSLEGMPDGRLLLILGGYDKGGDFTRLRDLVRKKVRQLITIGAAAQTIERDLAGTVPISTAGGMERAVSLAREIAREGDVVLLSPGCASFDQYSNFEERGEHFERLVRELAVEAQR
jgi:UDP-N-acetylmuramoylalanine--D-glutamate ligase